MTREEISDRLRELKIEDFIWVIYIGIIVLSWYANSEERNYFLNNNLNSRDRYRAVMIFIFVILVIVYSYFLTDSYESLKKLKPNDPEQKKHLTFVSFIGSLLVFISGILFLYIVIKDETIDVEIAFN